MFQVVMKRDDERKPQRWRESESKETKRRFQKFEKRKRLKKKLSRERRRIFFSSSVSFFPLFLIKRNGYWHSNSMFWCVMTFDFLLWAWYELLFLLNILILFLWFCVMVEVRVYYNMYFSILVCYALVHKLNRKIDARTEFRIDGDEKMFFFWWTFLSSKIKKLFVVMAIEWHINFVFFWFWRI